MFGDSLTFSGAKLGAERQKKDELWKLVDKKTLRKETIGLGKILAGEEGKQTCKFDHFDISYLAAWHRTY